MSSPDNIKRITIAISSEIYTKLEECASQDLRSVTNFISYDMLQQFLVKSGLDKSTQKYLMLDFQDYITGMLERFSES